MITDLITLKTRTVYDYISKKDFIIWSLHEFGFCVDIPTINIIHNLKDTEESHVEKIKTYAKNSLKRDKKQKLSHYLPISKCVHNSK